MSEVRERAPNVPAATKTGEPGKVGAGTAGRSESKGRQTLKDDVRRTEGYESQTALLRPPGAGKDEVTAPVVEAPKPLEQAPVTPPIDLDAARMYANVDPRLLRAIGEVVNCTQVEPPGQALVAAIKGFQSENGLPETGAIDSITLRVLQQKSGKRNGLIGTQHVSGHALSSTGNGNATDTGEEHKHLMRSAKFVGESVYGGLHPVMIERLSAAEARLASELATLLGDETEGPLLRQQGITSTSADSLRAWLGINRRHTGWRVGALQGYHRYGCAIDVNRDTNAWVAVRTGIEVGGEGRATKGEAKSFDLQGLEVIDRAGLFMRKQRAELHAESAGVGKNPGATEAVVKRFSTASQAVADYFALVFVPSAELLKWGPKSSEQSSPLPTNLALLPDDVAIANVERVIREVHGGSWSLDARAMVATIKADLFPLARNSASGTMTKDPKETKNPTRGFMDLDGRLAAAMTEAGRLYWGGCEFGVGESGDLMHFDTGMVPA